MIVTFSQVDVEVFTANIASKAICRERVMEGSCGSELGKRGSENIWDRSKYQQKRPSLLDNIV